MKTCPNCGSQHDRHSDICNQCSWEAKPTDTLEITARFYDQCERDAVKKIKMGDYSDAKLIPQFSENAAIIEGILTRRKQ